MEDALKSRLNLILAVLSAILFIGMVSSCSNAYRQRLAREKEMASRIDLEEKINNILQERNSSFDRLKQIEKELEAERLAHEETKNNFTQEQSINAALKDELQKVIKLKEALEEDLKEALVTKSTQSSNKR